jgi:ribulose-phosphate 3-epimerase
MTGAARGRGLTLSASVTCMNPLTLGQTIRDLDAAGLSTYHLDVCDGRFARTFLLYPGLLPHLRQATRGRLDVHLYCLEPSLYLDEFIACGAHTIIVQMEAEESCMELIPRIAGRGVRAGLGILPGTPVPDSLKSIIPFLSMVVANTVGPAYAGQPYDARGLETIRRVKELCDACGASAEIAVDGSVSEERLEGFFRAGADHLVLGTASVFTPGGDWTQRFRSFRARAEESFGRLTRLDGEG